MSISVNFIYNPLKTLLISLLIIVGSAVSSIALYSKGSINHNIIYSDLNVSYRNATNNTDPWKVSGCLRNRTSQPISFHADLYFNNYFGHHTGEASIRVTIPANDKACFNDYIRELGKEKFSESKIKWIVHSPKPNVKVRTKSKDESVKSYSKQRKIRNGYQFTGKGNVITKKIHLERGMLKAKSSYSGTSNFMVDLLKDNGEFYGVLANEIGSSTCSTGKHIRTKGDYYLKVKSNGSWRIELEMPDIDDRQADEVTPAVSYIDEPLMYEIHLKNGQVISVDGYQERIGGISFSRYGAQIILKKNKIKKIVRK